MPIWKEPIMSKKPRENRIPIMMSNDELASVDTWRFENHVATRSDAVRRLCQMALALDEELTPLHKSLSDLMISIKSLIEATTPLVGPDKNREDVIELTLRIMAVNMRMLTHKNTVRKLTAQAYNYKKDVSELDNIVNDSNDLKEFFAEVISKTDDNSDAVKNLEEMLDKFGKKDKKY